MEDRLWKIGYMMVASWALQAYSFDFTLFSCMFGSPRLSSVINAILMLFALRYLYLLEKTLSAANLKPVVWGYVAQLIVLKDLSREEYFTIDGAPQQIVDRRREAFNSMATSWKKRWPNASQKSAEMKKIFPDLRFKASGFESMFPVYQKITNEAFDMCSIVDHVDGTEITDIDGQKFLDSSGSYGVNCFGHTHFKRFMDKGNELAQKVGPLLGPMHPVVTENIEMLLKIYDKEEVSFHMSGTEAVMCAVQQVRFHTGRPLIAVFSGAYHGWWDGVMQGAGNPRFNSDCLVLTDRSPASLSLLKARSSEIAGVLVNPVNGMGWGPCATSGLTSGGKPVNAGPAAFDKFRTWIEQVRETCNDSGIPLIYDETWAFQLGPGGAQKLLGVKADIVTIGKSVGGGHAVGAVMGSHKFMERSDPDRPMRVSFVVGTFKGSPMVMGSMNSVLKWITSEEAKAEFSAHEKRVQEWVVSCNDKLKTLSLPLKVHAYRNLWCISFDQNSPYNFLFHCYLRDAGLQMVWVGTAKALINLEFKESDLEKLTEIIVAAAEKFKGDEWWYNKGTKNPSLFHLPTLFAFVLIPTLQYWLGWSKRCEDKRK